MAPCFFRRDVRLVNKARKRQVLMIPVEDAERPTADLEIGLHRSEDSSYSVELRYRQPDDAAGIPPVRGFTQFDFAKLKAASADMTDYSKLLGEMLFRDEEVRNAFNTVRAQSENCALRIRLFIAASAPELHGLRWETLRDPETDLSLATNFHVLFSRYMSSFDWRPVSLSSRSQLQALVVIANPSDITNYQRNSQGLTPIDVQGELERAEKGLQGINHTALTSNVTLDKIAEELQKHEYDILYLVCHGALREGTALLYLEREDGQAAPVAGNSLVTRLGDLKKRPSLVVLASCQSAGVGQGGASSNDQGMLSALGPRLARVGVPAIVAMQDNITMTSIEGFMPAFFGSLLRYGQVDRAMAIARGRIQDRFDSWVPVLFMRLESGRIWRESGFEKNGGGYSRWATLTRDIAKGYCTPILGSGLLEPFVGSSREIAQQWAETYHFPMSPFHRDDLPQVAQYVSVDQRDDILREEFVTEMLREMTLRYRSALPPELRELTRPRALDGEPDDRETDVEKLLKVMNVIGRSRREPKSSLDSHKLLASFPFPMYLTTNPDNMLTDALKEVNKKPQTEFCRWKEVLYDNSGDEVDWPGPHVDELPDYQPTPDTPLVYHLFGNLEYLDSLVLTEDNYFDYLIGVTEKPHPSMVGRALSATALLFLGFKIDDWDFRALFRNLMRQEGRGKGKRFTHVAVQIDPEEGRIIDPDRARRYLQRYFGDVDIDIYWGGVDDFLKDLRKAWNSRHPNALVP